MVSLDEGEFGVCLGPSGHDSLDLNDTYLYDLVDLKVSNNLLEVVPV